MQPNRYIFSQLLPLFLEIFDPSLFRGDKNTMQQLLGPFGMVKICMKWCNFLKICLTGNLLIAYLDSTFLKKKKIKQLNKFRLNSAIHECQFSKNAKDLVYFLNLNGMFLYPYKSQVDDPGPRSQK